MIVGDIGGTKTQLGLIESGKESPVLEHCQTFLNSEHDCFDGLLSSYLMELGIKRPNTLCLSVAGPVTNQHCELTNLPWALNTKQLSQEFNIPNVYLINDLAATAHSVPLLPDSDFAWLQTPANGNGTSPETVSVLSAGTGLGEASLIYSQEEQRYFVVPGEGGHKNFAPSNDQELALLTHYLKEQEHISVEKLVSGDGLSRIYHFLSQQQEWNHAKPSLEDADTAKNLNELITQLAFELPDSVYSHTVTLFSQMLLSEAGNLALQTYSNGGVVIAGGIPPKILPFLQAESSLQAFRNKGRFHQWLSCLPVRVCLNVNAPLIGAWAYGKQQEL